MLRRILWFFILNLMCVTYSQAAVWVKLQEKNGASLMLDKQSVLEKDALKRAWVKISYKTLQMNDQVPDKSYNLSKLLWFFDCPSQKAATSQVFQYLNDELIYSAAVDVKLAKFIEPVPETEVDIVMRHVCEVGKASALASGKSQNDDVKSKGSDSAKKSVSATSEKNASTEKVANPTDLNAVANKAASSSEGEKTSAKTEQVTAEKSLDTDQEKKNNKPKEEVKSQQKDAHKTHWTYEGEAGPENWGKLSTEYAVCDSGKNQSPINVEKTIHAALKPLKTLQKFPGKEILNNGHTVQINFKEGNMMVLDDAPYQMKQVHFHAPSENTIKGKFYPLEAHFVHADSKGNLTVIGVMFEEGKANQALERLWQQMPKEKGEPIPLKSRVLPSEMIPQNRGYYRFSGSLTTPPCSEGVRWVLMKTPMTASKEQIEAFKAVVHQHNNRPVQQLNGRAVLE